MSVNYNLHDSRGPKGKASALGVPPVTPSSSGSAPTTFFLRREKEMDRMVQRGRKSSRGSDSSTAEENIQSSASLCRESSFGVQSLEDTLASTFGSVEYLTSDVKPAGELGHDGTAELASSSRLKRKSGNPVHPKIVAAGRRIISSEYSDSTRSYSTDSLRHSRERRHSNASSVAVSQPFTPLRASPPLDSTISSTPRSASPKSLRLDDDESSVILEATNPASPSPRVEEHVDIVAHTGVDTEDTASQLVMPSLSIPRRRPFTENGRRIGRIKLVVVGRASTGKTSLIQNLFRTCPDIVHADPVSSSSVGRLDNISHLFAETHASTKPHPSWWVEAGSRSWSSRRKSFSEGSLDRNLCFIEAPAIDDELGSHVIETYLESTMSRAGSLEGLDDSEIIQLLGGNGNTLINAVVFVADSDVLKQDQDLSAAERSLLQKCCRYTNVIPVIGHADRLNPTEIEYCKQRLRHIFVDKGWEAFSLTKAGFGPWTGTEETVALEPFAVSSALDDDVDTIDASILMSSQYVQPLVPSDLEVFSTQLLQADNVARMRHMSAIKFSRWRREAPIAPTLGSILTESPSASRSVVSAHMTTSTGSLVNEPSKVMVPYGTSSYFRSASPSVSETSAISRNGTMELKCASQHFVDERTLSPEPYRRVRLAKWAQDLQRSLDNERQRYKDMYTSVPVEWNVEHGEKGRECSLITTHDQRLRSRGRLGGAVALIDPRDPLGILALSQAMGRRSWLAVRVAGGLGLIGAAVLWAANHWSELQDFFGAASPVIHGIPAPTHKSAAWTSGASWREFFGY